MSESLPPIYKFLTLDMRSPIGASEPWKIGRTMRVKGDLVPCENGLHGWPMLGLLNFTAERLVRVEIGAEYVWHGESVDRKVVASEMTPVEVVEAYNDRTLRLFAADCAERVLPLYEARHPNDDRPRRTIETARRFANGEATRDELAAAGAAAWAAAKAAAGAAAWDAAKAAEWAAAGAAAKAAAGAAAWDAAKAAEWAAAWDAAKAAAGDAAGDAAWDAAKAAAGAAARVAEWAAAGAAAWDAEREWQARHLAQMLGLEVAQ